MAFPLTHLCVAWRINRNAQFLLGSIAPDAVHYRAEFMGESVKNIGATKKVTHLCPVSNERWGQVTDNDGWVECVKNFARQARSEHHGRSEQSERFPRHRGSISSATCSLEAGYKVGYEAGYKSGYSHNFAAGYAAHCLTDLWNNKTLWHNYRTRHPKEAAKGYASGYYADLRNIDSHLFFEHPDVADIMQTLEIAVPEEIPGIVFAKEVDAIKNNILHEHFKDAVFDTNYHYEFVTYEDTMKFIETAAKFVADVLKDILEDVLEDVLEDSR
ncbi:MAG: hypothetical protein FWF77_05700 [Defluviitaleaceae bacterium]|nr:hypothetical protein [Defluviitaleaceae bacterium]